MIEQCVLVRCPDLGSCNIQVFGTAKCVLISGVS